MMNSMDQQVLEQFASGDSAALQEILRRYGSMVKGVCVRVLGNPHDADDAAQAVFLVLARKAASLPRRSNLSGWLYTVAFRCALRLRKTRAERQKREIPLEEETMNAVIEPVSEETWETIHPILDEELAGLSEKYRLPLVHCYLEGLEHEEAARKIGVGYKTLTTRLARGRELLRRRLVRRGVTVSGAALGTLILQNASSAAYAMSDAAIQSAVQSVMASGILAGPAATAATGAASATAIEVMKGVLQAMLFKQILIIAATVAVVAVLPAAVLQIARSSSAAQETPSVKSTTTTGTVPIKSKSLAPLHKVGSPGLEEDFRAAANRAIEEQSWIGLETVLATWSEKDFNGFVGWANQLPKQFPGGVMSGANGHDTMFRVAMVWAKKDPEAAAGWAGQLPEGDVRNTALGVVFAEWAGKDPEAAAGWAGQLPKGNARNAALGNVASQWARKDLAATAKWSQQLPEEAERNNTLSNVAEAWVEKDPEAAANWAQQLPKRNVLLNVVSRWALKDPAAAAKWAQQLSEAGVRDEMLSSVVWQWSQNDPVAAAQLAMQLTEGVLRNQALSDAGKQWAGKDPEAAAKWAQQLPEGEVRNRVLSNVAEGWAKKDPAAAVAWAEGLPTETRDGVDQAIVKAQVGPLMDRENNFQKVLSVVQELPASLRQAGLEAMVGQWSRKDSKECQQAMDEWLKAQPAGATKDGLIRALCRWDYFPHPGHYHSQRLEWIGQMTDEKMRRTLIERTFQDWVNYAPQTAKEWLEQSSLPEEEKAKLRKMLK